MKNFLLFIIFVCLFLSFSAMGSDLASWASNCAIVLAILYSCNPPSDQK